MWSLILLATVFGSTLAVDLSFTCQNPGTAPHWYGSVPIKGGIATSAVGTYQCGPETNRGCDSRGWFPTSGYVSGDFGPVFATGSQCYCGILATDVPFSPGTQNCGKGASCKNGQCGDSCGGSPNFLGADGSCKCGLYIRGKPLESWNIYSLGGRCEIPSGLFPTPVLQYDVSNGRFHAFDLDCSQGQTLWNDGAPGSTRGSVFACYPSCPTGQVLSSQNRQVGCFCDIANNYFGTVPNCRKCPDGCTSTTSGCTCGSSTVWLSPTNNVWQCPAGLVKSMDSYSGSSPSNTNLCICPQYSITLSNGQTTCTACTGPLQIQSGSSCSCPIGTSFTSDLSACACPTSSDGYPQSYDSSSQTCIPCRGAATVSADGTQCQCAQGAIVKQGVCACDAANNFGITSNRQQCLQCGPNQIIDPNGYCSCDSSKNFVAVSGSLGQQQPCRACPSNAIPSGTQTLCQCTEFRANWVPSTFTCVTCTGNDYFDSGSGTCKTCPTGSQTYGNGCEYICRGSNAVPSSTGCKCLQGFAPTIPGDTSTSLSCTKCADGYAVSTASGQCALCPIGNGLIISSVDGKCTCDTANGYGFGTNTGTGPYFNCQKCPANSTPSMSQQQTPAALLPGCYCNNAGDSLLKDSSGNYYCGVGICSDPTQTYIKGLGCKGPCPAHSTLSLTSGTCSCDSGWYSKNGAPSSTNPCFQCADGQYFSASIQRCAYTCGDWSFLNGNGQCLCYGGYAPADPTKINPPVCVKCASNQVAAADGCHCTATGVLGPCAPAPSGGMKRSITHTNRRIRKVQCPSGLEFCPGILESTGQTRMIGGECIDPSSVHTCGGCGVGPYGTGYDCGDIDDADIVRCVKARCVVESCVMGVPASNFTTCISPRL